MNKMSLEGKRVLVTGADGFIGSHLVEQLLALGAKVRALVFYNSQGSWGLLEDIKNINKYSNPEVVLGDIRDPMFCLSLVENQDIVFHLAALIAIPYSYVAPISFSQTNVLGTANLLAASVRNKVKKFIHTSTSEVYGTALYTPIDEKHPTQPQSPYSASKIGADALALSYCNSFGLPVVVLRPFNNFGPRQSARAVIPTIITQVLDDHAKEVELGSLKPIRDYIFVKDTVLAYIEIALLENITGETINIGVGDGYSIEEIYKTICEMTHINKKVVLDQKRVRPDKSEVWKLICDNKKMEKLSGWKPPTSFSEGLKLTVDWIKKNKDKFKSERYNI